MNFWDNTLLVLLNPRTVHELPGRIRVHMPVLRKIPAAYSVMLESVANALTERTGILEISPSRATGNVLIRFDPSLIAREELMSCLRTVTRAFLINRRLLNTINPDKADVAAQKIGAWLAERISDAHPSDETLKAPDDVLE